MPSTEAVHRAQTLRMLAHVARQEADELGPELRTHDDLMQSADWLETKAMLLDTGHVLPPAN